MPRLGGTSSDDEEEGIPLMMAPSGNRRRDREATAYASASGGGNLLVHLSSPIVAALKLLKILVGVLVVRNMLAHVSVFDLFEGPTFWMQ